MPPKSNDKKRVCLFGIYLALGLMVGHAVFESIRVVPNQAFYRHLRRAAHKHNSVTTVFLGESSAYYAVNYERFDEGLRARGIESRSLNLSLGGAVATQLQEEFEIVLASGLPKLHTVYIADTLLQHHLRRRALNKNESISERGLQLYVNQLLHERWNSEWLLAWKDLFETVFFRVTNWGVAFYNKIENRSLEKEEFDVKNASLPPGACDKYEDWITPLSPEWHALAAPIRAIAESHGAKVYALRIPFRTAGSCDGVPNCLQPLSPEAQQAILSEQYWWDCDHLNAKGSEIYTDALVQAVVKETIGARARGLSSQ